MCERMGVIKIVDKEDEGMGWVRLDLYQGLKRRKGEVCETNVEEKGKSS